MTIRWLLIEVIDQFCLDKLYTREDYILCPDLQLKDTVVNSGIVT